MFGAEDRPTEPERIRAYAGALLVAEALAELTRIRKLLTPKE